MDSESIQLIKIARKELERDLNAIGKKLPSNKDIKDDPEKDKIKRFLDCAVINYLTSRIDIAFREEVSKQGYSYTRPFDSVRGCFTEGAKISGMEIFEKTHIQIAIRNLNCIKGFFLPRNQCVFP